MNMDRLKELKQEKLIKLEGACQIATKIPQSATKTATKSEIPHLPKRLSPCKLFVCKGLCQWAV
jgi:hypothetical protein